MTIFEIIRTEITAKQAGALYGLKFDRSGRGFCPWHDDGRHAALQFFPDGGCYCHSCHANGDAIDIAAQLLKVTPKEAAERLYKDFRLDTPITKSSKDQIKKSLMRKALVERQRQEAVNAVEDAAADAGEAWAIAARSWGKPEYDEALRRAKNADVWMRFKKRELELGLYAVIESRGDAGQEEQMRYSYLCDVVREADARLAQYTPEKIDSEFDMLLYVRCRADEEASILMEGMKRGRT